MALPQKRTLRGLAPDGILHVRIKDLAAQRVPSQTLGAYVGPAQPDEMCEGRVFGEVLLVPSLVGSRGHLYVWPSAQNIRTTAWRRDRPAPDVRMA